jgi:hypothetical protein
VPKLTMEVLAKLLETTGGLARNDWFQLSRQPKSEGHWVVENLENEKWELWSTERGSQRLVTAYETERDLILETLYKLPILDKTPLDQIPDRFANAGVEVSVQREKNRIAFNQDVEVYWFDESTELVHFFLSTSELLAFIPESTSLRRLKTQTGIVFGPMRESDAAFYAFIALVSKVFN